MTAQTVCPGCRAELKLKAGRTAGATATCPQCGARVPLAPAEGAADPSVLGESDPTVRASAGALHAAQFPFLYAAQSADEIGRLGPYRILGELGRGGMGVVFRAEDTALRRLVALKVMLPQYSANPADKARFLREARAQAQVEHDHVAAIHQVGEDRGVAFLAMPLLKGLSLADALKGARVPVAEAVRIVREAAEGLAAAHAVGLIHRDIKPGNVWLSEVRSAERGTRNEGSRSSGLRSEFRTPHSVLGRVKILDFGLARPAAGGADASLADAVTHQGAIIGTPAYMSPEQARGEQLDARSDLFSLGVVLYQLLTGRQPFRAPTAAGVLIAVATEAPPPPSDLNADVPAALDAVTMALLAKRPDDRPPTADAVAELLRAIEESQQPTQPGSGSPAAPDPWAGIDAIGPDPTNLAGGETQLMSGAEGDRPRPRAARPLAAVALLAAVAVVAIAVYFSRPAENRGPTAVRTTPLPEPTDPNPLPPLPADPDRAAAEYVISLGGPIRIDDEPAERRTLPAGPFRLVFASMEGVRVTADGLSVFRGCTALKEISFHRSNVDDAGLAHFADCTELTLLNLNDTKGASTPTGGSKVTDAGLANFKRCKKLTTLDLFATAASDAGVAHFQKCDKLQYLLLGRTKVTDAGLANFKNCPDLVFLTVEETGVGDEGLANFAGCRRLQVLDLGETKVTNAGLSHFRDCKTFTELKLAKTAITDDGLAHFAGNDRLFRLLLNECPGVSDAGLAHFKGCKGLTHLLIDHTQTTDTGLAHFEGCKGLTYLSLIGTKVTDAAADIIKNFDHLTYLNLERTKVTKDGAARLHTALPRCRIVWNDGEFEPKEK